MTELFIAVVGALVVAAIAIGWWGFKKSIEEEETQKVQVTNLPSKMDFYSPVHAMIFRINSKISHKQTSELAGVWVNVQLFGIDHQQVTEAFTQHSTMFKDEDLKIWGTIEKEIKTPMNGGGFWLTKERLKWFDDLEARYNR